MTDKNSNHAFIAVPVRDEEQGLPLLLEALARQQTCHGLSFSVHLYFDGCRDRSIDIAKSLLTRYGLAATWGIQPKRSEPNAGRARSAAVQLALLNAHSAETDILLTTDADTVPDRDWVAQSALALQDVDVVAGYTTRDGTTRLKVRDDLESYLESLHNLRRCIDPVSYDPAPSHPWVGGANLGMTLEAHQRLQGFRPVASGEDKDLVDRARHLGLRVCHSRVVRATTSSRTVGRAKGGLANALQHMKQEQREPRVEHPADAAWQYARHALARRVFGSACARVDWKAVARFLGTRNDLRALAASSPNAEAFAMRAVPSHPTRRDLPLSEASRVLRTLRPEHFRAFDLV